MKHTELRKTCETYLEDLISEVKSESASEVLHDYFDFCARFHGYSFRNTLLIWMVRPNATRIAGFATWQKLGRFIKKGEKGIPIFAPMRIKKKQEMEFVEDSAEEEEITLFKVVYVWDVSQTDGEPLPEPPDVLDVSGSAEHILPALENLVRSRGIALEYADLSGAYGVSKKVKIVVIPSASDEEKFCIVAHEFAHELLHGLQDRVNISRKVKELEAEATAYTVCRHFGLETKSPAYLALYRVEEVDIRASLDRICRPPQRSSMALQPGSGNSKRHNEKRSNPGRGYDIIPSPGGEMSLSPCLMTRRQSYGVKNSFLVITKRGI